MIKFQFSLVVIVLVMLAAPVSSQVGMSRVPNTTIQMPAEMPVSGFGLVPALGSLRFEEPVAIAFPPGEVGRVFVVERRGRILVVDRTEPEPSASVFLDIRNEVNSSWIESGLLGLAFHPDYATNGYFYVFRTSTESSAASPGYRHNVVVRYSVSVADPNAALLESKEYIVKQLDVSPEHNGGDIHFGPDGYLYFSIGDNGPGPVDASDHPHQPIDGGMFGGVFRIDVDLRPDSVAPNPHHAVTGNYAIPPDNPFIGVTEHHGVAVDPGEVRTEFYAYGFRNPWRFSFHPVTGALYLGDVGNAAWEEINIVEPGENYGWPYIEGLTENNFNGPGKGVRSSPPEVLIRHGRENFRGNSIVGGVFYQGSDLPGLDGAYIYGDHRSGHLWAMFPGGGGGIKTPENWLASKFGISSFGRDAADGSLLVANVSTGEIDRLVYVPPEEADPFPQTLDETGIFADLTTLEPNPGVLPYQLNQRFWSDYADKTRWFSVPDVADKIDFSSDGQWQFPAGTVWVKHFDLEMVRGDASSKRRLETRVIVGGGDEMYGVTYRWDPDTGVAALVPAEGMDEPLEIQETDGSIRQQVWRYPGRGECATCHTPAKQFAVGFNSAQLNRDVLLGGELHNQIKLLSEAGYFENPPDDEGIVELRRESDLADERVGIHDRARSYLSVNCSFCHRPGTLTDYWDGRLSTDYKDMGFSSRILKEGSPASSTLHWRLTTRGIIRMPTVGSYEVDQVGQELVRRWIASFPLAPWEQTKLGNPEREGSASVEGNLDEITVAGASGGVGSLTGQFLHQGTSGSTQTTVRLDSQFCHVGEGSAGLMMRGAGGEAVFIGQQTDGQVTFELLGGTLVQSGGPLDFAPGGLWLRLKRENSLVSAEVRPEGGAWVLVGAGEVALPEGIDVGVLAGSESVTEVNTAKFGSFAWSSVTLLPPGEPGVYEAGDNVLLEADVDRYGTGAGVDRVEFYRDDELIGEALAAPWEFLWRDALAGDYQMTVLLRDDDGSELRSASEALMVASADSGAIPGPVIGLTGGDWIGVVGENGNVVAGAGSELPDGTFVEAPVGIGTWGIPTADGRLLELISATGRSGSFYEQDGADLVLPILFTDGGWHDVTLYFLDADQLGREQVIRVFNPDAELLFDHVVTDFGDGRYLTIRMRGEFTVTITATGAGSAVLSGVFFDDVVNVPPLVVLTAPLDGSSSIVPHPIILSVEVGDEEGIASVSYFVDGKLLGVANSAPWQFLWDDPLAGYFEIVARAEDLLGAKTNSAPIHINLRNPFAIAEFIGTDDSTQGNWIGVYGGQGFSITDDEVQLPDALSLQVYGESSRRWTHPPIDETRAPLLSDGASRVLAPWYNPNQFSIDVGIDDGGTSEVSFYTIDWYDVGWAMTVRAVDRATGVVLDSRAIDETLDGRYLRYRVRGGVRFEFQADFGQAMVAAVFFDRQAAPVPVVELLRPLPGASADLASGLLLDVAVDGGVAGIERVEIFANGALVETLYDPPFTTRWRPGAAGIYELIARARSGAESSVESAPVTVEFTGTSPAAEVVFDGVDLDTSGDWIGSYGDEGFLVINDSQSIPDYVDFGFLGGLTYVLEQVSEDPRALQTSAGLQRTAAFRYAESSFDVHLGVTDGEWHHVAMNFLDWSSGRVFTVDLIDTASGSVLDSRLVSEVTGGLYLRWFVRGDVTARLTAVTGDAVLSGVFFQEVAGFENWVGEQFALPIPPGVAIGDPDGDEVKNLIEYKFGSSPHDALDDGGLQMEDVDGEILLAWDEAPFTTDVSIGIEVSDNLVDWEPAGDLILEVSRELLDGYDHVETRLSSSALTKYFRLVAAEITP